MRLLPRQQEKRGAKIVPMQKVPKRSPISKQELHVRLRAWLGQEENRIDGQAAGYGNSAWMYVRDGTKLFRLHRDTKRNGVEDYLDLVAQHGDTLGWSITWNRNKEKPKGNAVEYGPDQEQVKRFYL